MSQKASSELPTSDRTYGDTNQLLALTPRQPEPGFSLSYPEPEPCIRPAPGRSTTETTIIELGRRSATASLHGADSPQDSPESQSTQKARGDARGQLDYPRDFSSNTMRSDEEGDWETTRSDSNIALLPRPSRDSYANTSTYSEGNRLSTMSGVSIPGNPFSRPKRAGTAPTATGSGEGNTADVEKAKKALRKMYKDKMLDQGVLAHPAGDRTGAREVQRGDRGSLQGWLDRRQSTVIQARNNDIELEEIRKKNPEAVRLAADQIFAESVAEQTSPPRPIMPMERLRGVFSRSQSGIGQSANRNIMNEALVSDSSRNLLARTPTAEDRSSRLEFSESANTFRTFRETPAPSENNSRTGFDLGERSSGVSISVPATAYVSAERPKPQHPSALESRYAARDKQSRRPARRAAMSSQTSLRALITSGSPTSNIQGAFTDREMAEASHRWDLLPRHHTRNQRYNGRNASGPFPRFNNSPIHYPLSEGRMLVRPSEAMDPRAQLLQERLSKRYLMRMLACPPMCILYHTGYYDYLIAKQTNGQIKVMSPARKEDALSWAALVSIVYCFIVIGIAVAVAITRPR